MRPRTLLVILVLTAATAVLHGIPIPSWLRWLYERPLGDKLAHLLIAGTLAYLANRALGGARVTAARLLVGSLVVAVLFTLEEGAQVLVPHRICDPVDLFFDYLGIACASVLARRPNGASPSSLPPSLTPPGPRPPSCRSLSDDTQAT